MKNVNIFFGLVGITLAIIGIAIGIYWQAFGILLVSTGFIIGADNPFSDKVIKKPVPRYRVILSNVLKVLGLLVLLAVFIDRAFLN